MPTESPSREISISKAKVVLKFIVVGAGISGLAAALTLRRAGHDVLVLEKGNGKIRSKGGIQSPPNMTKLLQKWGLGPTLTERSHKCDKFFFKNGSTGEMIGFMNMGEAFLKDLSADFLFLQHKDLYTMLYQRALSEGVEFKFDTTVLSADSSNPNPNASRQRVSVTLVPTPHPHPHPTTNAHSAPPSATNPPPEVLYADVVVGADGFDSRVRGAVTGEEELDGQGDGVETHVVATFVIPVHRMEEEKELRVLLDAKNWRIWLGDGYIMNTNVLAGEKDFTATIIHNYSGPRYPGDLNWTEDRSLESLGIRLSNFEPVARKVLMLATSVSSRIYVRREVPEDFVCDNSRIVLVGESAHPLLPASNHGVAMVLEDAQTLGLLFSRIRSYDQVSQILTAYDEIRHDHCADVCSWDYVQRGNMRLPLGPEQEQRDAVMRMTMLTGDWDQMDDSDVFRMVWGYELKLWGYDPTDKVEDWWGMYGGFIMRRHERGSMEVKVEKGDVFSQEAASIAC